MNYLFKKNIYFLPLHCLGLDLPLAIGIGPKTNGCMFITDHKLADFFKAHPPEHSSLKPRVIYISKEPVFGSIISYKALEEVQELEKATNQESLKVMDFVKRESAVSLAEAAMILNHASSIAVFAFDEQLSEDSFNVLSIIKAAMATRSKKVVLLVPESKVAKWKEIISCCFDRGILRESVRTFQLETVENIKGNDGMYVVQTVAKTLPFVGEFMTEDTNPRKFTAVVGSQKQGIIMQKY